MSTARNRFGVSILVAWILAVLLQVAPAEAAPASTGDFGLNGIEDIASMTSTRTQMALALGAGVPLLVVAFMVRRRMYADA